MCFEFLPVKVVARLFWVILDKSIAVSDFTYLDYAVNVYRLHLSVHIGTWSKSVARRHCAHNLMLTVVSFTNLVMLRLFDLSITSSIIELFFAGSYG